MKKVLIADDSGMARTFIKRTLEMVMTEEAVYIEAVNGRDALEKMKDDPPDLLVTDLNMPELDGAQLLKRIIASPKLHGTPSIVITSLDNEAKHKELKGYGVTAILGKPVDPGQLSATLEKIFGKGNDDDNYGW
ncbi:MAG: response regulator [Deltaproteobacteria bacterium]|nr:response regulator [Deltaproteobacteria bacterium]